MTTYSTYVLFNCKKLENVVKLAIVIDVDVEDEFSHNAKLYLTDEIKV